MAAAVVQAYAKTTRLKFSCDVQVVRGVDTSQPTPPGEPYVLTYTAADPSAPDARPAVPKRRHLQVSHRAHTAKWSSQTKVVHQLLKASGKVQLPVSHLFNSPLTSCGCQL